jgi:hypothetical protein
MAGVIRDADRLAWSVHFANFSCGAMQISSAVEDDACRHPCNIGSTDPFHATDTARQQLKKMDVDG